MISKYYFLTVILCCALFAQAQDAQMADELRAQGKIYIVVGVLAAIFVALVVYLAAQERRIRKMEKEIEGRTK